MKLLIIRHAIAMERADYQAKARDDARQFGASNPAGHADDDFRPLTPHGDRKMRKTAKGISRLIERPHLLVSSPLTRAMQTAEILRERAWHELDLATSEFLRPGSNPADLCKWLKSQPPCENPDCVVALVGHEPHLSSLVSWLMAGAPKSLVELKKGGACLLEFRHAPERSRGRLLWLATPAILRR